jgi:mono/diheme cytochrome c family protein
MKTVFHQGTQRAPTVSRGLSDGRNHSGRRALLTSFFLVVVAAFAWPARANDGALEAKNIFNQRCTACHTYGKGVKVGPDLKGVTDRRQRPWLLKFIRSSQSVIKAGDPVARGLFQQFKQQRMPDWTDLKEQQITNILNWLAAAGPEFKELDERNAEVATPADIQMARALFHGEIKLSNGGLACGTCHDIRDSVGTVGASLGPDLTGAYLKYQDRAMTLFLKRPCFVRAAERSSADYLMPQESFALKAYMRKAALSAQGSANGVTR